MKIVSVVNGHDFKVKFGSVYEKTTEYNNKYRFIGIYNFDTGEINEDCRDIHQEFYFLNENDLKHFIKIEKMRRDKIIDNILK